MAGNFVDDHKIETYKSMVTVSVEAFKLLALLNGGAVAGILAAFDKIRSAIALGSLKAAIIAFILGLISIAAAFICSYATQNILFNEGMGRKPDGAHMAWLLAALTFMIVSLGCFAAGALVMAFNIQ